MTAARQWIIEPSANSGMTFTEVVDAEAYEDGMSPVCWALLREMTDPEVVARLSIPGEPQSKARPRFTTANQKKRTYTPAATKAAEEAIGWQYRRVCRGWRGPDREGEYGVFAKFFAASYQRRDVDNMLKLVLDALTGLVWADDSQVTEVSGRVQRGVTGPSTEVIVYRIGFLRTPTAVCEFCGNDFRTYESWKAQRRFCSQTCRLAWNDQHRQRGTCEHCSQPFIRTKTTAARRFCGQRCRYDAGRITVTCDHCGCEFTKQKSYLRDRNFCSDQCQQRAASKRRKGSGPGRCDTCGGPTSKTKYHQCRGCRMATLSVTGSPQEVITEVTDGNSR